MSPNVLDVTAPLRRLWEYGWVRGRLAWNPGKPVIVYQMGKVGSTSVTRSLRGAGVAPVFQVHRLREETIDKTKSVYQDEGLSVPRITLRGEALRAALERQGLEPRFVTLVREPVARSLSDFFQNFTLLTGLGSPDAVEETELGDLFFEHGNHSFPSTWLSKELETVLGIEMTPGVLGDDHHAETFQTERGPLLILRAEMPDEEKAQTVAEWLGLEDFSISRANETADLSISHTYYDLRDSLSLPEEFLQDVYDRRYARCFYSEQERGQFIERWS